MDKNQYIVVFEIGSSKIVGAVAEKSSAGMVSVSHLVEERLSNCVRYGCVQNVENVKAAINRILKNIEDQVGGNIKYVYVGVSGRSLHSEVSEVNRGLDAAKPISAEIISGIIRDASRNPIKNYETIAVVPRTYVVDKNVTADPVGVVGSSIKIKANLIVAKPAIKQNLMRVFSFGIDVKDYIVTPLAVGENVLTDSERLGCMLVDLGAETTTVSIYKDGSLAYLATLPLGGRNITRDISNGLSVLEDTAERVKKNINNPLESNVDDIVIEGVNSSEAANFIAARNREIIANIKNQLNLAGMTADDIRTIVLIGGGAQLKGLEKKLEENTKLSVRMGHYPQSLNILNHSFNRPEYIETFCLLAKAAAEILPGETCIIRRNYDDGFQVSSTRPAAPKPEPEPVKVKKEEKGKSKKTGFLGTLGDRLSKLFTEDDADDDQ